MALASQRRAQLNADALRVSETLTPDLYRAIVDITCQLRLPEVPRTYVYADPSINAMVTVDDVSLGPLVVLTSGMVELLSPSELHFPIGHELGHFGLEHAGYRVEEEAQNEYQSLQWLKQNRVREISADRIGLVATASLFTAAGVIIKTSSGLSSRHVRIDVEAYLDQLRELATPNAAEQELFSTHPNLPLRLRALLAFSESSDYLKLTGTGAAGRELGDVDREVAEWLDVLEGGGLSDQTRRRIDLAVVWTLVALHGGSGGDWSVLREAAGPEVHAGYLAKAIQFHDTHGADSVLAKLSPLLADLETARTNARRAVASTVLSTARAAGSLSKVGQLESILLRWQSPDDGGEP
jgi:hypothetical protein